MPWSLLSLLQISMVKAAVKLRGFPSRLLKGKLRVEFHGIRQEYRMKRRMEGGGAGQSRNVVQTKIGKAESDRESGGKNRDRGIKKKEHETKTETWEHRQEQAVLPSST